MVKFFDINAGKPGDKAPAEPPKKDDVVADEPKRDEKPEHLGKPKPEAEAKDVGPEKTEPLRPDFSVPQVGSGTPKPHDDAEPKPAEPAAPAEVDHEKDDEVLSKAPEIPRATPGMAPKLVDEHSPISPTISDVHPRKQRIVTAILSIILIVLLALLVSQAVIYFTQTKKDAVAVTPKATTTPKVTTPTTASADTTAKTTTPATTPPATTSTALTKEKAIVRILNGSGVAGAAGKVSALIKAASYTVSGTGNAKSYTYATTQVLYKNADAKSVADDVVTTLKGYTAESKLDDATPASAIEIVVVVGKK